MVLSDTQRQSSGHFNLVQFSSREFLCTQKSPYICALPRLSDVSPTLPSKQFQCLSDWQWPPLILSRKIVEIKWARPLNCAARQPLAGKIKSRQSQVKQRQVKLSFIPQTENFTDTHIIKGTRWFWNRIACAPNWFIQWQKKCYTSIIVTTGSLCGRRSATLV